MFGAARRVCQWPRLVLVTPALIALFASGCSSVAYPGDASDASDAARDATLPDVDASPDVAIGSWVHRFGGEGPAGALLVACDTQRNVYVAGTASIASFTSNGTPRWSHYIPNIVAQGVASDRAGNFYVAGVFTGEVDFGGGPVTAAAYRRDPFVASFTPDGTYRWARVFGDSPREVAARVAVDDAQNVFVTGIYAGTLDFGNGPVETSGSLYHVYLASYDGTGTYRWSRTFGDSISLGPSVSVDDAGHVFLVGQYLSSIDFGGATISSPTDGRFLASFDNDGATRWARDLGSAYAGSFVTRDGTTIVARGDALVRYASDGTVGAPVTFDPAPAQPRVDDEGRLYLQQGENVASYSAEGALRWSHRLDVLGDPSGSTRVSDFRVDAVGNLYLAASFTNRVDFGTGELTGDGTALTVLAPDGAPRWSQRFGTGWTRAHSVAVDDAAVYVAGTFTHRIDFGGEPLTTGSDGEIYLASLTRSGAHRWSRRFGGVGGFRSRHRVALDREGNVYLAGIFAGTVDFGGGPLTNSFSPTQPSDGEAYVASFTRDGVHRWSRRLGATLHAPGADVAIGANGTVYVAFRNSIATFRSNGEPGWTRSFESIRLDRGIPRIAVDDAGNAYFTGVFVGAIDLGGGPIAATPQSDIFVASFTSSGAHRWSHAVGRSDEILGSTIAVDANGRSYLAAYFRGRVQFGGPPLAPSTTVFRSYASDGSERWTRVFAGVGAAYDGPNVAVDSRGEPYLTSEFQGAVDFGNGARPRPNDADAFVAHFDADGTVRSVRSFAGAGFSGAGTDVAIDREGGVFVAGVFSGAVDFGIDRLTSESVGDVFVGRFTP